MDAKARRLLWNDILSLIKENRIVILTSHSMEECEALCTRLVIMVNGEFKCLGSPQHLKGKFGNGYKLLIRVNEETQAPEKLFEFMKHNFPFATNTETHKNLYEYILPFKSTKLSQIFGILEKNRESLHLKDYSVAQTTLDQIFVNFAKSQSEEAFTDTQHAIDFPMLNTTDHSAQNQVEEQEASSNENTLEENINKDGNENEDEKMEIDCDQTKALYNTLFDSKYYEDIKMEPLSFK
jgi:ABC-type multidrug transport system ATPase subunit